MQYQCNGKIKLSKHSDNLLLVQFNQLHSFYLSGKHNTDKNSFTLCLVISISNIRIKGDFDAVCIYLYFPSIINNSRDTPDSLERLDFGTLNV